MIGKVIRGTNVRSLLYYLYGPGKENEHTDPRLVAGFGDPAELEPDRLGGGRRDFRRLTGLLSQPLAALNGDNYAKPVWHCVLRAAPEDRVLSDAEWARVAAHVMDRVGLAPDGDEVGVRWVAVRHAPDHVHIVATLARVDRHRPDLWNSYRKLRRACRDSEEWFGLRRTAAADCTAAKRDSRAEVEQAIRRGWDEPPRTWLRREVCTAAAGARTEDEFFAHLGRAGVQVRRRYSTVSPGEVTGYAVGVPGHTGKDGQVWYGGGKLAADLSLPKLRARWGDPVVRDPLTGAAGLPAPVIRGVLRATVGQAAAESFGEAEFFARLRASGLLVRERFSEINPGEVTGYAVSLRGHTGTGGAIRWYGGGRLHDSLTLPRLRARWEGGEGAGAERSGAFRITVPERADIYRHAARQAAVAAEHLRRCAAGDPGPGADAAWAAADALRAAARVTGSRVLRCAADGYDRAARAPQRQVPRRTGEGDGLRAAARLLAMTGGDGISEAGPLARNLLSLVDAVADLRAAQAHAAQAAAARQTAEHLHAAFMQATGRTSHVRRADAPGAGPGRPASRADAEFPVLVTELVDAAAEHETAGRGSRSGVAQPPARARPAR